MSLPAGEKLGPYEILGLTGTGGMGEVYRARDSRLGRDVAIKVSAERFTERFEREARLIASLNHPNVCTLHDVGPNYLVMELVEGPTLAERINQGAIPFDEAVNIARQIADALEAAHEKGIVHRDLKPGNVKIKPDGVVKVLDFGLAKLGGTATAASDSSPTMTMGETQAGVILGTAAYMPPEQAKGREVDKRADIWAFGVVLYEMLTGRRLFQGETTTETLAAVIEREPRWEKAPDRARPLLRRCLEKDPKRRLRDIGDAMGWLESAPESLTHAPQQAPRRLLLWPGLAAVSLAATALMGFFYVRSVTPAAALLQFEIAQPPDLTFSNEFAVSPDGRKLAYIATGGGGRVWIRSMDAVDAQPLTGTEGALGTPFWSPDSRHLVFWAQNRLMRIEASGGPAQTLCATAGRVLGGFWTGDNKIVFAINQTRGLQQVSAAGGACSPLTDVPAGESRHSYPTLLPDGRHFVYTRSQSLNMGGIYLGSLDAKPGDQGTKRLLSDISATAYVPSVDSPTGGYLLFVRSGTLMAQPFDSARQDLEGEAVPVAERVAISGFSASLTGILAYRSSTSVGTQQLTWVDRKGKTLGVVGDPSAFENNSPPALSPDGKRVAFARTDPQSGNTDIWLFEFARGVSSRFTFDPGQDLNPVWSPDSSRIAFTAERGAEWGIYLKAANLAGGEELLYKSGNVATRPSTWSRDGRYLLYSAGPPYDIGMIPMDAGTAGASGRKPMEVLHTQFNERGARFSPDGRLFAYTSNSSGKDEIYVQTFDASAARPAGGTVMVSKDGGGSVRWRGDGREIFYNAAGGELMSVDVSTTPVFQAGVPKTLFRPPSNPGLFWDVTPDGQKFLFALSSSQESGTPYTVVQNWHAALKK